jgi:GNAT superfamily N-acetyltransferase
MSCTTEKTVSANGFTGLTQATINIRPASPADLAALGDFFAGLSVQTRYLRFFAPVRPTPAMLHLLSGGGAHVDAVVAVRGGVIIGHAMAADQPATEGPQRPGTARDPVGPIVTDIGVVVADAWQGRGVGSALVRALVTRAQARGVTSMAMEILHVNRRVLAMIERRWPVAETGRFRESASIHIRLPRSEQLPTASADTPHQCRPSKMRSCPSTRLVDARNRRRELSREYPRWLAQHPGGQRPSVPQVLAAER